MARTRTCKGSVLAVAVALVAAGCDPYPSKNRAKPEVLAVFASDGATVVDGQLSGGTWTLALPSFSPAPSTVAAQQPVIIVKTNKLLDGSTIQTTDQTTNSDGDCTPKDGWLGVSPAPAAGNVWYSCYDPSSPTTLAGSSIVLFQGAIANPISSDGPSS